MLKGKTRHELRKRYGSYTDLANLPADLPSEALEHQDRETLLHSECIYRICSLIAFGRGLACLEDIEGFTDYLVDISEPVSVGLSEYDHGTEVYVGIKVYLPYVPDLLKSRSIRPRQKDNDLLLAGRNGSAFFYSNISLEPIEEKSLIVRCGILNESFKTVIAKWTGEYLKRGVKPSLEDLKEMVTLQEILELSESEKVFRITLQTLGQLIANELARVSFIGVFNGVPVFEPRNRIEAAWYDLATLTDKQLPGLCPACGRVVDRWCGSKGGQPKVTCCNKHSDGFYNEQKRLRKLDDPDMQFRNRRAMKARELRYRCDNNQRPLMDL